MTWTPRDRDVAEGARVRDLDFFELAPAAGPSLHAAMAACAPRLLAALPGFAVAATAEWTTEAGGEDAVVHARGTTIDEAALAATFREHPDVVQVRARFHLEVVALDGVTAVTLEDGARLHLEREDAQLAILLDLHVDLYAKRKLGAMTGDNAALARLKRTAPRRVPRAAPRADRRTRRRRRRPRLRRPGLRARLR